MTPETRSARLKTLRLRSGLSQQQVAKLLDLTADASVSRHERLKSIASLITAMGYEVIFRTPMSTLFPELFQSVEMAIEARIAEMETEMQKGEARGEGANRKARTLEFFYKRRNPNID